MPKVVFIGFGVAFLVLVAISIILAMVFNYRASHSPNNARFLAGKLPPSNLDGFYEGNKPGTTWQGKVFDGQHQSGINRFKSGDRYVFKTYTGKGLKDHKLDVLKIDYNQPGNPWWLKFIVDELVQTDSNHFLGKVHLKFIPGLPVTVTYFELSK